MCSDFDFRWFIYKLSLKQYSQVSEIIEMLIDKRSWMIKAIKAEVMPSLPALEGFGMAG